MKLRFFGTDGIRGAYGSEKMNESLAHSLGLSIGKYLLESGLHSQNILLGRDPRPSGESLQKACSAGIVQSGHHPWDAGILPTPALSFGVRKLKMSLGVMITASHNPSSDNGLKLFSSKGAKFSLSEEARIEELLHENKEDLSATSEFKSVDIKKDYLEYICGFFPENALVGKRFVLDTANGATCQTTPEAFTRLGARITTIHSGDGSINHRCGSESMDSLREEVQKRTVDLGIAHDGDGDRARFVDFSGKVIEGDKILGLLAAMADRKKNLKNKGFVATIHSNSGLLESLLSIGIKLHRAQVGDRNVSELMDATGCNWGGESSGHVLAHDYLPTGDGLFTALCIANEIKSGESILASTNWIELWPSRSDSFQVSSKIPLEDCVEIQNALDDAKIKLSKNGRVLLRYSGTEPKIRLLVEAKNQHLIDEIFPNIMSLLQKAL